MRSPQTKTPCYRYPQVLISSFFFSSKKEHLYPTGRIEQIQNLSKIPDIYEQLARAIAPSIYENEDVKKGILLLLFGGARKDFSKYGRGQSR